MLMSLQLIVIVFIWNRLSSSAPTQKFQTQNCTGLYQLCPNRYYIIAGDRFQTYKGHRLLQLIIWDMIYSQYEEQCILILPEFNTTIQIDAIQSMT
ncbi:unnamed protein product [Rotaria socialis]